VIRVRNADNTKWCLLIYTSYAADVLTMAAADDYALAKNVTVGDETYEWPAGSIVEIVAAADEIGQIMTPIQAANAGEVFFEESGVLKTDSGLVWDNTDKQLIVTKTAIGATQGDYGLKLINTTAAAAGAQQYSPPSIWQGQGWKTDATAASQAVAFRAFVRPIQGAAAPTGAWDLQASIGGGAYSSNLISISSAGYMTIAGRLGVGATPSYPLQIQSAGAGTKMTIADDVNFALSLSADGSGTGTLYLKQAGSNKVVFDATAESNSYLNVGGNLGLGTPTFNATARGCFVVANGTAPAAHTDDQIYIYSKDSVGSAGATFGLELESPVVAIGTFTPSHKLYAWINGVEYAIQLDAV